MNLPRLQQIQSSLKTPLLVKKKENLFYITGQSFDQREGECLLIKKNDAIAFGSGLGKMKWCKKSDQLRNIAQYLKPGSLLDLEYGFTYGEGEYLKHKLPQVKIQPVMGAVDAARQIKDRREIKLVKKSMQIVEEVFGDVKTQLQNKQWTEIGLAQFIQKRGIELGAQDVSFPAIVASGPNAAVPHHVPGTKLLKKGESIVIDFGFKYNGYCSDFTRTVFLKFAPNRLAEAYNQVEKAYNQSILLISRNGSGVRGSVIYRKCVDVLKEKSLDRYFIHSLGHGTGLEIHELPNLSALSKDVLQNGMVFSVEPGVYFPRLGGIRIEDLVYIERGTCKKFITSSTKLADNIF